MENTSANMKTIDILNRLNEWRGWSDYRIAKMLEVSQSAVSTYRTNNRTMSDETARKAAELLGLPEELVVACIQEEREQDERTRAVKARITRIVEKEFEKEIESTEHPFWQK